MLSWSYYYENQLCYQIWGEKPLNDQQDKMIVRDIQILPVGQGYRDIGICILGWAQWNLSSFEFKFDDTGLSS